MFVRLYGYRLHHCMADVSDSSTESQGRRGSSARPEELKEEEMLDAASAAKGFHFYFVDSRISDLSIGRYHSRMSNIVIVKALGIDDVRTLRFQIVSSF